MRKRRLKSAKIILYKILSVCLLMIVFASCVTRKGMSINRMSETGISPADKVMIVGDEDLVECLKEGILDFDSKIRVVNETEVRGQMPPEFKEEKIDWFADRKVYGNLRSVGIRYLVDVFVKIKDKETDFAGNPYLCSMYHEYERDTRLTAEVWKLDESRESHLVKSGVVQGVVSGKWNVFMLMCLPAGTPVFTEGPACGIAGKGVAKLLKGIDGQGRSVENE